MEDLFKVKIYVVYYKCMTRMAAYTLLWIGVL